MPSTLDYATAAGDNAAIQLSSTAPKLHLLRVKQSD
jgi:hypothetical protein